MYQPKQERSAFPRTVDSRIQASAVKTVCPHCSARLRLKHEGAPAGVTCPKCQQRFRPEPIPAEPVEHLPAREIPDGQSPAAARRPAARKRPKSQRPPPAQARDTPRPELTLQPGGSTVELMRAVVQAFEGQTVQRAPTLRYRLELLFSAVGLALLILAYFACVAGIGYGLYAYGRWVVPAGFAMRGRAAITALLVHVAVGLAGLCLIFSLLAPLFRRNRGAASGVLLPPSDQIALHCFVRALCNLIKAPLPDEIRLGFDPNASAGRERRFFGLFRSRLVLSIGAPLLYGLDLRALAGVIAHELGHFSQATSMGLVDYISTVSHWFEAAAEQAVSFQESVSEHTEDSAASVRLAGAFAWFTTELGRFALLGFAFLSRLLTFHLSRQAEFDADRYEAQVAGSAQFQQTFQRIHELAVGFHLTLVDLLENGEFPTSGLELSRQSVERANNLSEIERHQVDALMAPQRAHWFHAHPSPADRVAAVAQLQCPGIFQLKGPAEVLLNARAMAQSIAEAEDDD